MTMQPLDPEHPVMLKLAYLERLVTRHEQLLMEMQHRWPQELARSAGSAARETPGASTELRT